MSFSRREFLKTGGISAVGLGILISGSEKVLGQFISNTGDFEPNLLSSLNAESFNKFIGTEFTFYTEEGAYQGILSEVIIPSAKKQFGSVIRKSKTTNSFFLKFDVRMPNLAQETYKVYEKSLGQFDLLLVPGTKFTNSTELIATFNRI